MYKVTLFMKAVKLVNDLPANSKALASIFVLPSFASSLGKLNELAARKKILTLLNIDPGVELEASSAADYKTENTSSLILQSLLIRDSMEMPNKAVYTRIDAEMHNYEIIFGFVTVIGLFFISLLLMIGVLLVEIKTYRIVSSKFKIAFFNHLSLHSLDVPIQLCWIPFLHCNGF